MTEIDTFTSTTPLPEQAGEPLPPYSGQETTCIKCGNLEAFTRYRSACTRRMWEFNGAIGMRGPFPERLERQCQCCDYTWDEALNPADSGSGSRAATTEEIAFALQASRPYGADLHPELAAHMAGRLQNMLQVLVRTDHPSGTARPTGLLLAPTEGPIQPDPALSAAAPVVYASVPVPLHERVHASPTGPTTFAPGGEL